MTALPPGVDVNYSLFNDDYHCLIGWSQPTSEVEAASAELATEAGVRRICSGSGLPMDAGWRYLGHNTIDRLNELPDADRHGIGIWEVTTAAFIDEHRTVVGCLVQLFGGPGATVSMELSVGADGAAVPGPVACPVEPRGLRRADDGILEEYELTGAGAVRGADGQVLTEAATLRIGVAGDGATSSHPVVDGIAIVNASTKPTAAIHFEWDDPPPLEGKIYDAGGRLLSTCRG